MSTLLVGYDLDRPAQNYANLEAAIKSVGDWWHHLDSTWLVVTPNTPMQVRDLLAQHIDPRYTSCWLSTSAAMPQHGSDSATKVPNGLRRL